MKTDNLLTDLCLNKGRWNTVPAETINLLESISVFMTIVGLYFVHATVYTSHRTDPLSISIYFLMKAHMKVTAGHYMELGSLLYITILH